MEAQRQAMQKQIEDTRAKIKPLLTPDQQKQLDALPIPGQKPSPPPGDGK
jgi:Spy/CpxP family protein refolding chaperone